MWPKKQTNTNKNKNKIKLTGNEFARVNIIGMLLYFSKYYLNLVQTQENYT